MVDKTTMINTYLSPSTPNQAHPILIPAYPPRHFIPTTKTHTRPKASPPPMNLPSFEIIASPNNTQQIHFSPPPLLPKPQRPRHSLTNIIRGDKPPNGNPHPPNPIFSLEHPPKEILLPSEPPTLLELQ